jgi:hypothetical protein
VLVVVGKRVGDGVAVAVRRRVTVVVAVARIRVAAGAAVLVTVASRLAVATADAVAVAEVFAVAVDRGATTVVAGGVGDARQAARNISRSASKSSPGRESSRFTMRL